MVEPNGSHDRWYFLGLAALTHAVAIAMPLMCMPVLFEEISVDLNLSLLQIGAIWGAAPLAGVASVLIGGLLGDRFGIKKVLSRACFLAGVAGALRGLSGGFTSLTATTFLFGLISFVILGNVPKVAGIWFTGRHLGFANGILGLGAAIGFMAGAMLSATVLSLLLGSWRLVLLFYGLLSVVFGVLWVFTGREAKQTVTGSAHSSGTLTFRQTLSRVAHLKSVWLIGVALLGHASCILSMLGYLPLYLRERGWSVASADGTVAAFHGVSVMGAIPLALLSDRLKSRDEFAFRYSARANLGS